MERIGPLERHLKCRPPAVADSGVANIEIANVKVVNSALGGFEMRTTRIQDLAVVLFLVAVLGVLLILSLAFGKPGVA